ncbi:MAG: enhanced serine sensitivity protein SseB C-terminal domain-containing protein [Flavipsychrobacter sp.]|nr:enhanced serine sensitivity protein SseB C-terminal domain-containing protein [Flavipsychrobacter sp.]
MNLFKKLFGSQKPVREVPETPQPAAPKAPDNTRLNYLLDIYGDHPSTENYNAVLHEIMEGNAYLLLPSKNDTPESGGRQTMEIGAELRLTCVVDLDGLQAIAVFSTEKYLLDWTKSTSGCTSMRCQDLLEFCAQNGLERIVINSNQKNEFVLEKTRAVTTTEIKQTTQVLIGTPPQPLPAEIITQLVENFSRVSTITEAYQYGMHMNGEFSIALGIRMSVRSDESQAALRHAVARVMEGKTLNPPVDVMMIDDSPGMLQVVLQYAPGSLFYKRAE